MSKKYQSLYFENVALVQSLIIDLSSKFIIKLNFIFQIKREWSQFHGLFQKQLTEHPRN